MLDNATAASQSETIDPVTVLLDLLAQGNDVIRCATVKALAHYNDERVRSALLARLQDEDPDVRTDTMVSLLGHALPVDAATIRASLEGDPVREVKAAAIDILTKLQDAEAVTLLRALSKSRADDLVAWEDESDAWDDWLELQSAAINALGKLGVVEAIPELLALRDDEYGQDVDNDVFAALSDMKEEGATALMSVVQTEDGRGRRRALEALTRIDATTLLPYTDYLLGDDSADIRMLALPLLDKSDDRAVYLALHDDDATLRSAAIAHVAAARPEVAISALSDASQAVQAMALKNLNFPLEVELASTLSANMQVWIKKSGYDLTTACAEMFVAVDPEQAASILLELIGDSDRPHLARVAAVKSLVSLGQGGCTPLVSCLSHESQQIRMAVPTGLMQLATPEAQDVIIAAMNMHLSSDDDIDDETLEDLEPQIDVGAPKGEGESRRHVRINDEGEIVSTGMPTMGMTQSTLGNIQFEIPEQNDPGQPEEADATPEEAEATPEESTGKRRKRVAVDGPDNISLDLVCAALGVGASLPGVKVTDAAANAAASVNERLSRAGYSALAKRAQFLNESTRKILIEGFNGEDAYIRQLSAEALLQSGLAPEVLIDGLVADDAQLRAYSLASVGADQVDDIAVFLSDPSMLVRNVALSELLRNQDPDELAKAVGILVDAEQIDTLSDGVSASKGMLRTTLDRLQQSDPTSKHTLVIVEALAKLKQT